MVVEKSYCENLDCQSRLLAFTAADFPSFLRSMLVNYEPTLHQEQRLKPCDYRVSDLYARDVFVPRQCLITKLCSESTKKLCHVNFFNRVAYLLFPYLERYWRIG